MNRRQPARANQKANEPPESPWEIQREQPAVIAKEGRLLTATIEGLHFVVPRSPMTVGEVDEALNGCVRDELAERKRQQRREVDPRQSTWITIGEEQCPVDPRMARLVEAMNLVPGLKTIESCGGHAHPEGDQAGRGYFYVTFQVTPDKTGFQALGIMAFAIEKFRVSRRIATIEVCLAGLNDDRLDAGFSLHGNADPDSIAIALIDALLPEAA